MEGVRTMKLLWVMIALLVATLLVVRAHSPPSVSPPTPSSSLPSPPSPFPPQNVDFQFQKLPKFHLPPELSFLRVCAAKCRRRCLGANPAIVHRVCMAGCLPIECRPSRLDVVHGCALECMAAAPAAAPTSGHDEIDDYNENCFKICDEKY